LGGLPISHYLTDIIDSNVLTLSYCRAFDIPPNKLKEKIRAQWLGRDKELIPLLKLWGISINNDFTNFRYGRDFLNEESINNFDPTFIDSHFFVCDNTIELDELIMELTLSGEISDDDIYMDIVFNQPLNYRVILIQCINMTSLIIDRANTLDIKNEHKFCYQGQYHIKGEQVEYDIVEYIQNAMVHNLDLYLASSVKLKEWVRKGEFNLQRC